MAKFIKVTRYRNAYGDDSHIFVLNVSRIVSFFQCYFNGVTGDVPYVYLSTTRESGLCIAGTMDELLAVIEGKEGA